MSGTTAPQTVFTVGQLAEYLKASLDADPALADIWITGEVSDHRGYGSGHHYFSLRDPDSRVQCVMFRGGRGAEFLEDGAQVLAHGRVSYYTARGDLQLYVDLIKPEGVGALQIAFEQLKQKLEQEGLFDPGRKRPLPRFPQRIAIVTSPTGAVLQDILNILRRRYPLVEVLLAPTAVQGDAAAPAIVDALATVNATDVVDAVIVARGGGSLEDLWPFNEEIVARAIFSSRVPVISAVGHETDITIADLVADVRAPTPSAAAEIVVPDHRELAATISDHVVTLTDRVQRVLDDRRSNLNLAADRLYAGGPDTETPRVRVDDLLRLARVAIERTLQVNRERLRGLEMQLRALGPADILGRGYAIVKKAPDGPVLSSVADARPGDLLNLTLADGEIEAETHQVRPWKDAG